MTEDLGLSIFPTMHTQLEEWLVLLNSEVSAIHNADIYTVSFDRERSMDIFSCLFEYHEEELTRKFMEAWQSFQAPFIPLSRTDCWLLQHCFQYCPEIKSVNVTDCNITAEKLRILKPVISRCKALG